MGYSNPWDEYAELYVEKMDREGYYWPRDEVLKVVLRLCGDHLDGRRALDVACGFGYLSRILMKHGASVTAVDNSGRMIEIARKEPLNSSVIYHVADSRKIPIDSGTFDMLVCNMALQDIEDVESTIQEMHRLSTKGARIVFSIRHPFTDGWDDDYGREKRIDNPIRSSGNNRRLYYPPRYHRPLCFYLNCMVSHGISIEHCEEIVDPKGRPFAIVIAGREP